MGIASFVVVLLLLCGWTTTTTSFVAVPPPTLPPPITKRMVSTTTTTTTMLREHLPMDPWDDALGDVLPDAVTPVHLSSNTHNNHASPQNTRMESQYDMSTSKTNKNNSYSNSDYYPFANMMQNTASYIANHRGSVVVVHLPGTLIEDPDRVDSILQDLGLCWLLGMKLILVVSGSSSADKSSSSLSTARSNRQHQLLLDEEKHLGFLRHELERKLNRCLRAHHATSDKSGGGGNVVSGNTFCSAQTEQVYSMESTIHHGHCHKVHTHKLTPILERSDVVLLSTLLLSESGEHWINVQGPQLAAKVATSMQAQKLILLQTQSSMLRSDQNQYLQEVPLGLARDILAARQSRLLRSHDNDHDDSVSHPEQQQQQQQASSPEQQHDELYQNLEWGCFAVSSGVHRAHLVNPNDGALLEELFTSQNGLNTCLYHDNEQQNSSLLKVNGVNDLPADDFYTTLQTNSTFYFG